MPGGTVSSCAEIRSMPRSTSSDPSQSRTPDQLRASSTCASISAPQSRSPAANGSGPSATWSDSDRLCAGSVEITSVR